MGEKLINLLAQVATATTLAALILIGSCKSVNKYERSPKPSYTVTNDLSIGYLSNTNNFYQKIRD